MASDYSKNFEIAMTGLNGLGQITEDGIETGGDPAAPGTKGPVPGSKKPEFLYLKTDSTGGNTPTDMPAPAGPPIRKLSLTDTRTINPATGKPFKGGKGGKSFNVDEDTLTSIISHAKAKGVNPYDALAIALQETEFGRLDPNYGSAWSTFADEGIEGDRDQNANILAKALKEKLAYAKKLGLDKKGEAHMLQVYNGYGVLKPTMKIGDKWQDETYYGIPVTAEQPLDLRQNPAYGKTVISLRDELLKKDKRIAALIESTAAYGDASGAAPTKAERLRQIQAVKKPQ